MGIWDKLTTWIAPAEQPEEPVTFESLRDAYVKSVRTHLGYQPEELVGRLGATQKFPYHMYQQQRHLAVEMHQRNLDALDATTRIKMERAQQIQRTIHAIIQVASPSTQNTVHELMNLTHTELSAELKIHLQPIKSAVPKVWERLLNLVEKNSHLRKAVYGMKVSMDPNPIYSKGEVVPEIVLYAYDKNDFETIVSALQLELAEYEQYSNHQTPRFNQKVTDLIYVAQSSGDLKSALKRVGLLDEYFDASSDYAFFKGEEVGQRYSIKHLDAV